MFQTLKLRVYAVKYYEIYRINRFLKNVKKIVRDPSP